MALNPGANQYTCPTYSTKVSFMAATVAGDITTSVNKGRRAGPMRGRCTSFTIEKTQPRRRGQTWPLQNKNEK